MRVYELAKKLKIKTKKVLLAIKELRIRKKSPLSSLTEKEVERIKKFLKGNKGKRKRERVIKKKEREEKRRLEERLEKRGSSSVYKKEVIEEKKQPFIDLGKEIPERYKKEYLVLLPVNPDKIFAYWELEKERHGEGVLRVYYRGGKNYFDVDVDTGSFKWYVDVPYDGEEYFAELGIRDRGRFFPVLRSNIIKVPRKRISEKEEIELTKYRELIEKLHLDVKGRSSVERVRFEEIKRFLKGMRFLPSSKPK
ncbi:MAG: hypothetical protein DRI36_06225 [Caldiserica bacterium]|nr:MAG: hypothetical protein DRI36_06225 [Caldisericota bacterium]